MGGVCLGGAFGGEQRAAVVCRDHAPAQPQQVIQGASRDVELCAIWAGPWGQWDRQGAQALTPPHCTRPAPGRKRSPGQARCVRPCSLHRDVQHAMRKTRVGMVQPLPHLRHFHRFHRFHHDGGAAAQGAARRHCPYRPYCPFSVLIVLDAERPCDRPDTLHSARRAAPRSRSTPSRISSNPNSNSSA
jgi:hypothetical protein